MTIWLSGLREHEVAEFDSPATIAALEAALADLGHDVERVGHVRSLAARLVAGWRCDLVFNIAEGVAGFGRESQVPALLEAYEIPYTFSDPLVCALTLHKGMAKHVARGCGVPTPSFMLVSTVAEAKAVTLPLPLFAKPVAEGSSKGVTADRWFDRRPPSSRFARSCSSATASPCSSRSS